MSTRTSFSVSLWVLLFMLLSVSVPLPAQSAHLAVPSDVVLFEDGFETTVANTYPSATGWWNAYGGTTAYVTTSQANGGVKSFLLQGASNFSRRDLRNIPQAEYVRYEVSVRMESTSGDAWVGFNNPDIGAYGTGYAQVRFWDDGSIGADGQFLQTYQPNRWYDVRVEANFETELMNVYVDDVLVGDRLSTGPQEWTTFMLSVGHTLSPTYFDDVTVTKLFCQPAILCDDISLLPILMR